MFDVEAVFKSVCEASPEELPQIFVQELLDSLERCDGCQPTREDPPEVFAAKVAGLAVSWMSLIVDTRRALHDIRDPDGCWTDFAARVQLLLNPDQKRLN